MYIKRVTKRKAVNIGRKRKISKRKTEEKGIRKNFFKIQKRTMRSRRKRHRVKEKKEYYRKRDRNLFV